VLGNIVAKIEKPSLQVLGDIVAEIEKKQKA